MINFDAVIINESQRFAEVLSTVAPDAAVPTCPDWNAADLAWHLTQVHAFWARILGSEAVSDEEAEPVEGSVPERPGTLAEILALFDHETLALLAELRARKDEQPAWFWVSTFKTVGITRRMQAHEATMHRVDAELAAGLTPSPIDPALAADGIRHALEVMWAWWGTLPGFEFVPGDGVVELVATDAAPILAEPGRWQGVGQSGRSYDIATAREAESGSANATITGTAEQLMRWLWGRGDEPAASGDERALDALREARAQGMQ